MGRPPGAISGRHHHVLRRDHETERMEYGRRVQTLAAAWADVRKRAAADPLDLWRVATCPTSTCRFSQWG